MQIRHLQLILVVAAMIPMNLSCAQKKDTPNPADTPTQLSDCVLGQMTSFEGLMEIEDLPNPFLMRNGSQVTNLTQWACRRKEVIKQIQFYETGIKPDAPDTLSASISDSTMVIRMVGDGKSLELTASVILPQGEGPFPAVIGIGFGGGTGSLPAELFTDRGIATIQYNLNELAPWGFDVERGSGGFYELYSDPSVGFFTAWSWGVSRLIDGLELLPELTIDLDRLAITGCSFAGKIALFSASFDERIALTIAQEPGGGGAAPWRVTETLDGEQEILKRAQGAPWYASDFSKFNEDVDKLPYDHHQLVSLVAPRALLVLGNPDYEWLAEESTHVGCEAAKTVWKAMGVPERLGYSIVAGHPHCQLPVDQQPEVIAFIERYLLDKTSSGEEIAISPYSPDLDRWIKWKIPDLLE